MDGPFEQLMFFRPPWWNDRPYEQNRQTTPRDAVPPRVQIAMQVHAALTAKTADTPLPLKLGSQDSVEFEPMPGQKLTPDEELLLNQCAILLENYIRGAMPQTPAEKREQRRLDALEKVCKTDAAFEGEVCQIGCPECVAAGPMRRKADCKTCRGQGYVYIPFSRTEAT